jgi:hypothetical protein
MLYLTVRDFQGRVWNHNYRVRIVEVNEIHEELSIEKTRTEI